MQWFHQYLLQRCILQPISAESRAHSLQESLLNPLLLLLLIYEAAHKSQKWGRKEDREKFRESSGTQVNQNQKALYIITAAPLVATPPTSQANMLDSNHFGLVNLLISELWKQPLKATHAHPQELQPTTTATTAFENILPIFLLVKPKFLQSKRRRSEVRVVLASRDLFS